MVVADLFDVIIVGGGPAGCATALSLSKHNPKSRFIILDDADPAVFKIGESLPPESSRLLHYLHPSLLGRLASATASGTHLLCTGNASAWASTALEDRHAILNPFGHGYHLDRAAFDELLRSTICVVDDQDNPKSTSTTINGCIVKGKFTSVERDDTTGHWVICAGVDGKEMTFLAKWVVDATGRKASLATKLGARIITSDPLLAFYALFTSPSPDSPDNDHRTIIEATAQGWFYSALLSLSPPTRIVAFHTLPTHPAAKHARRRDGFLDLIATSSVHIAAAIERCGYAISAEYPRCTAAGSSYLDRACDLGSGQGWLAVGDAAMAFDPLSSQGMMTALEMGCYVGTVLAGLLNEDEGEEQLELQAEAAGKELEGMYRRVREEYEKNRAYYYGIVGRFRGEEFWNHVQMQGNHGPTA